MTVSWLYDVVGHLVFLVNLFLHGSASGATNTFSVITRQWVRKLIHEFFQWLPRVLTQFSVTPSGIRTWTKPSCHFHGWLQPVPCNRLLHCESDVQFVNPGSSARLPPWGARFPETPSL